MSKLELLHTLFEQSLRVGCVAFSADAALLVTQGGFRGAGIRVWNTADWQLNGKLPATKSYPACCEFIGASQQLAVASDNQVQVLDCLERSVVASHSAHRKRVTAVASVNGTLFSGDQAGEIFSWDISTGVAPTKCAAIPGRINSLAASANGKYLAVGGGVECEISLIQVWDLEKRLLIKRLQGHSDWVLWVGFSPDNSMLATGSYSEICFWDTESWQLRQVLRRPAQQKFSTIAFSFAAHPGTFVSGGWSHEETQQKTDDAGNLLGWNAQHTGLVQLWELATGQLAHCYEIDANGLSCLAYHPQRNWLAVGSENSVRIWKLSH